LSSVPATPPARGEIWLTRLDPVAGHEQQGTRPSLVVSADLYNRGPQELVAVLPITTKGKHTRWRVTIEPPEGGLVRTSWVLTDQVRTISTTRLVRCMGTVNASTLGQVDDRLLIFLDLRLAP
jgi:mRNA interferase MazF